MTAPSTINRMAPTSSVQGGSFCLAVRHVSGFLSAP